MKSKKHSGFTLYEILVVLAIVILLLAIVINSASASKSKARDARRVDNIKTIQSAIENYFASCFSFPADLAALQVSAPVGCPSYTPSLLSLPTDPQGASYGYYVDAPLTGKRYHLCATLENASATKGKLGKAPFPLTADPCNGTAGTTFDVAGGIY